MIWYIIGGLFGVFYLKKKYNLKFWSAVWNGIMLALGVYFAIGVVLGIFTILTGLEDANPTLIYVLVYALFALGGFSYLKRLKKNNSNLSDGNKKTDISDETYSGSVDRYHPEPGDTIETSLAGVTFDGRQELLRKANIGQSVRLIREPKNIYDTNAINVTLESGHSIGYINRDLAKKIAPIFDSNKVESIFGITTSIYHVKNETSIIGVKVKFVLPYSQEDLSNDIPF